MPDCKRCSKCGEVKALGEFAVDKRNKDGTAGDCKGCRASAKRSWVEASRGHLRAYARTDAVLAKNRRWKSRNRTAVAESRREWYERNREHCLAYASEYDAAHPERANAVAAKRRRQSADLSDAYVRRVLSNAGLPPQQLPASLVNLKREQLLLLRLARELKRELEKHHGD